ncbi:MAG: flagellar hook-associated protein FlgL [Eubacteriales bacterium]|nr:flagellar hook-associated protein FlgL [Clostridia bacterium]
MRVTNQGLLHNYLSNLNRNLTYLSKFQNQLSSGKEIHRPSDDPFGSTRVMSLRNSLAQNKQYLRNIEDSMGWIDMTDTALGNMGDILTRIKELSIQGFSGTMAENDRHAVEVEVKQLIDQLAQIGNTKYDGKYIFAGSATTQRPFSVNGDMLSYNGTDRVLEREISERVSLVINIPGNWINEGRFAGELTEDLASTLNKLVSALATTEENDESHIEKLEEHIDNILALRAEMGAKYNRLEAAKHKNEEETLNMTELLSKTEDIDFAGKIMEYMTLQNVYMASLSTGAKIMMPTLLDFLR